VHRSVRNLIYHHRITTLSTTGTVDASLAARAYDEIRRMIIQLDLAPGDVVREAELQQVLGIGRTPIREALQRLAREHFVTVIPRRGMLVASIDVDELALLYETRAVMEPFAARLACSRGTDADWDEMDVVLSRTDDPGRTAEELLALDRRCHEIVWRAAGNRFLTDTLDTLYAQSDRLWHMYLADVSDMADAVEEHRAIHDALTRRDADRAAMLLDTHVRSFDVQVRAAVSRRLGVDPT
jgi:DNA-binding GntR family transcriptional regulator